MHKPLSLVEPTSTKQLTMNSDNFESTYAMLMRSQERERNLSETIIYSIMIASMFFTAWQVAHMPVRIPEKLTAPVAQSTLVALPNV